MTTDPQRSTSTPTARPIRWDGATQDRAAGVLMGMACGDALGAPYEFDPPLPAGSLVAMVGGGRFGWEPGEWTDDTQMAVVILQAAVRAVAAGEQLTDRLDEVAQGWVAWAATARDVGSQTGAVLAAGARSGTVTAGSVGAAAAEHHARTGRSGGNGSLMRTAPVALAHLEDPEAMARAARAVSDLTHPDQDAGDACVLWCAAIRHAVLTAELDVRVGLGLIPEVRRALWRGRIEVAEASEPAQFEHNGWVVEAFQAAWSAITRTPVPDGSRHDEYPADHLRLALEAAVRGGWDTDTVAAIAGGLLGARWGSSAIPTAWQRVVHGWPELRVAELGLRGLALARGISDPTAWPLTDRVDHGHLGLAPTTTTHPDDQGVLLGNAPVLDGPPTGVDAVVSLCRVGLARPVGVAAGDHVQVWLVDSADPAANPHLAYVLREAADAVAALRAEGRTVLLHCAAGQSRTPTVAAMYGIRHRGIAPAAALDRVRAVLLGAAPHRAFRAVVDAMARPAVRSPEAKEDR